MTPALARGDYDLDNGDSWSFLMVLPFILIGLLLLVFWIWMFLDVLKNKQLDDTTRLIWGIGLLVIPPLAFLYFFVARSKRK